MAYLIDGNNLLYATDQCHHVGQLGRVQLCQLLGRWSQQTSQPVEIVFDGGPPPGGLAEQMRQAGVKVTFSGAISADAVIEQRIADLKSAANWTVVTTDRAVQHAVRYARAKVIDFRSLRRATGPERRSAARQSCPWFANASSGETARAPGRRGRRLAQRVWRGLRCSAHRRRADGRLSPPVSQPPRGSTARHCTMSLPVPAALRRY